LRPQVLGREAHAVLSRFVPGIRVQWATEAQP